MLTGGCGLTRCVRVGKGVGVVAVGQPVLVGATMGTSSYVLTGGCGLSGFECGLRVVIAAVGQPVLALRRAPPVRQGVVSLTYPSLSIG